LIKKTDQGHYHIAESITVSLSVIVLDGDELSPDAIPRRRRRRDVLLIQ